MALDIWLFGKKCQQYNPHIPGLVKCLIWPNFIDSSLEMMFYVHCVFILFASSRLMMASSSLLTAANYLAVVTALIHVEIPLSYSLLSLKFVPNYE